MEKNLLSIKILTKDTKIIEFQFRILHRVYATNIVRRKSGHFWVKVESLCRLFLNVVFGSYMPKVQFSRGCAKFNPVAFSKIQYGRCDDMILLFWPYLCNRS